jgi:glycosyltransferase involved in cell wall biosynthesis
LHLSQNQLENLVKRLQWYIAVLFLVVIISPLSARTPKVVGLLPVRNEAWIIEQHLRAFSKYVDEIVVFDDGSDDSTVAIIKSLAQECHVTRIIERECWFYEEYSRRTALLNAGRAVGGTHFVLLDADEMFTANCLHNNLYAEILALQPGQELCIMFYNLWKSTDHYCLSGSPWKPYYLACAFCDDGKSVYPKSYIHVQRTPLKQKSSIRYLDPEKFGLMHFACVNWHNLLVKDAWYHCLERIREPQKPIVKINERYAYQKNEKVVKVAPVPATWFMGYDFFDRAIYERPEQCREQEIKRWFKQYGPAYFAGLDMITIEE